MIRHHRHRLVTVLFVLVSLLFMQLAVAAYACPGARSKMAESAAMAEASMPCAEAMAANGVDDAHPNLCHAHCQSESQSAHTYQLPLLVSVDALPAASAFLVVCMPPDEAPLQQPHLERTTAPPLAIRNCCFRL